MVFFASMFLVRSSEQLLVFDTLAILGIMGVLMLANFGVKAHLAGAFHYIAGFVGSGLSSAFGPFALLGADIDWKSMPARGKIGAVQVGPLRCLDVDVEEIAVATREEDDFHDSERRQEEDQDERSSGGCGDSRPGPGQEYEVIF